MYTFWFSPYITGPPVLYYLLDQILLIGKCGYFPYQTTAVKLCAAIIPSTSKIHFLLLIWIFETNNQTVGQFFTHIHCSLLF